MISGGNRVFRNGLRAAEYSTMPTVGGEGFTTRERLKPSNRGSSSAVRISTRAVGAVVEDQEAVAVLHAGIAVDRRRQDELVVELGGIGLARRPAVGVVAC
jgi:hypothetical protein